jgi:hypothetical protein
MKTTKSEADQKKAKAIAKHYKWTTCIKAMHLHAALQVQAWDPQRKVNSWSNESVVRQLQTSKDENMEAENIVGVRYQATTGENTANWAS